MRKFKVSVLMLSSLVIAACSGGGGSDNKPSAPQANLTNTASQAPTETTQGNSTQQTNTSTTVSEGQTVPQTRLSNSGYTIEKDHFQRGEINNFVVKKGSSEVVKLSGYNRQYSFSGALVRKEGFAEVIVDNIVNLIIDNTVGKIAGNGLVGSQITDSIKSLWNVSKDPTRDVFYFGYETTIANIPKQGVITYRGNVSRYDNLSSEVKNIGESELIADFNTKKIKGELSIDGLRRDISLKETDINGNGFSGKAVAGEDNILFRTVEGQYEGKFFGPNAEEVAGKATFSGEAIVGQLESLNTSFSAEKISQ